MSDKNLAKPEWVSNEDEARKENAHGRRIENLIATQGDPTEYEAPGGRKLKARELFSTYKRHLNLEIGPSYWDAILCVIDHANYRRGRSDARQSTMAMETGLSRETINRALKWWERNTDFLKIENRLGRSSAYHLQWTAIERKWSEVNDKIKEAKKRGV
jgi:hypothetical protein